MDLLIFIGALAAFIILHELGHFIVCKVCGVAVDEFGLGLPPRLTTLFHWQGTEFTLNWLPLGGFVRPRGEDDPSLTGGLGASSPWTRLAVFTAGPVMNILVAAILYSTVVMQVGVSQPGKIFVDDVALNSPAASAGLLAGDLLVKINDQDLKTYENVQAVVEQNKGQEITLWYERDGQSYRTALTPRANPPAGQGSMGLVMKYPTRPVSFLEALPMGGQAVFYQAYMLFTLPGRVMEGAFPAQYARPVGFKGMYDIYQVVRTEETSQKRNSPIAGSLDFFASISASLGILNLLPIPALDGGRILFLLPEIVFRRRVPARLENALHMVGLMVLLTLLLYINIQDFVNPVQLDSLLSGQVLTPTP